MLRAPAPADSLHEHYVFRRPEAGEAEERARLAREAAAGLTPSCIVWDEQRRTLRVEDRPPRARYCAYDGDAKDMARVPAAALALREDLGYDLSGLDPGADLGVTAAGEAAGRDLLTREIRQSLRSFSKEEAAAIRRLPAPTIPDSEAEPVSQEGVASARFREAFGMYGVDSDLRPWRDWHHLRAAVSS
mmetsp:Transcript_35228/g.83545  ORF Transcript_35228/g.83545 Transcript_35228/m.83545 type:complete len:189 (+) Transcript_35228:2056-2622(+)